MPTAKPVRSLIRSIARPTQRLAATSLAAGLVAGAVLGLLGGCGGSVRRAEFFEIRGITHGSRAVVDPLGDADIALLWPDLIERPAAAGTAIAGALTE